MIPFMQISKKSGKLMPFFLDCDACLSVKTIKKRKKKCYHDKQNCGHLWLSDKEEPPWVLGEGIWVLENSISFPGL